MQTAALLSFHTFDALRPAKRITPHCVRSAATGYAFSFAHDQAERCTRRQPMVGLAFECLNSTATTVKQVATGLEEVSRLAFSIAQSEHYAYNAVSIKSTATLSLLRDHRRWRHSHQCKKRPCNYRRNRRGSIEVCNEPRRVKRLERSLVAHRNNQTFSNLVAFLISCRSFTPWDGR